jgi:hypothetical protein
VTMSLPGPDAPEISVTDQAEDLSGAATPEFLLPALDEVTVTGCDYVANGEQLAPPNYSTGPSHGGGERSGGTHPDWAQLEERKRQIGRRGEELVYSKYEPERLRQLGYSDEEIGNLVHWISRDNETADHDLRSVDERGEEIIIEVKSTTGDEWVFEMSLPEFRKAAEWRERYYLYRVINVATNHPTVFRYRNPVQMWDNKQLVVAASKFTVTLPVPASTTA